MFLWELVIVMERSLKMSLLIPFDRKFELLDRCKPIQRDNDPVGNILMRIGHCTCHLNIMSMYNLVTVPLLWTTQSPQMIMLSEIRHNFHD
jgi:hypothetical protein